MATREALLAQTFVELADTLVEEFDIIDLLTTLADRCVALLDAGAAGILLADSRSVLHVMAASTEQARLLELFQLQNQEGPCLDCFNSGQAIVNLDAATSQGRWPRFHAEASAAGFRSVQAVPLHLRTTTIGALNVFIDDRDGLNDADLLIAQSLADAATIAILHDQALREARLITGQLEGALSSRIVIEQAKGMLAERAQLDMDEAFARLRRYAREHNRQLSSLASELVDGTLDRGALAALTRAPWPATTE